MGDKKDDPEGANVVITCEMPWDGQHTDALCHAGDEVGGKKDDQGADVLQLSSGYTCANLGYRPGLGRNVVREVVVYEMIRE